MASQSTEPTCVGKTAIKVPICHNNELAIEVPTYLYSNRLLLWDDGPIFTGLTLMEVIHLDHCGQVLEATSNLDGSTCPEFCYYCPILTFGTMSQWIVSFALQMRLPAKMKQSHIQSLYESVQTVLHEVKWNGRQVIPTNSNHPIAGLPDDEFEALIGEKNEIEIREWMNQTQENIYTALDREEEGERCRSTNKAFKVWERSIISRMCD
ncbi:hypothetical protein IWW34DRAFT_764133 [Fusarium oxysporum f. sp. albedinis]|nr:hypothetical protein IWW34DRAFT_764133 [Fusarium oxysporum f. sp. albedinis]KAK2471253.1 hypothetical protein H9L39_17484 [Fusarium oxysporum f. sp. albedinis]